MIYFFKKKYYEWKLQKYESDFLIKILADENNPDLYDPRKVEVRILDVDEAELIIYKFGYKKYIGAPNYYKTIKCYKAEYSITSMKKIINLNIIKFKLWAYKENYRMQQIEILRREFQ